MSTRRDFVYLSLASAVALGGARALRAQSTQAPRFSDNPFTLGVASGYPSADSVVLWTRVAPSPFEPGGGIRADVDVAWELALDERMKQVVRRGTERASADWAHSVHVDVSGLEPARDYWYRFTAGGAQSIVGRTRTAPAAGAANARLKLAVASCQQYEHGYFSAYQHMLRDDLDAIVHTGDYIYEVSWGETQVRKHRFLEAFTVDDYRLRFAQYKIDPDLIAAHAAVPWFVTWDDHEVLNDYAGDVADGVAPAEMRKRRLAAYRAYYEHMPLPASARPVGDVMRIYTSRAFGNLASLYMLDERQYRSAAPCRRPDGTAQKRLVNCAELDNPARTMLGVDQEAWLSQQLAASRTTWNLLGQGVVMSYIDEDPGPDRAYWADAWNANPTGRERLMTTLVDSKAQNPVVLSGDVHAFIVSGLHRHADRLDSPVVATELVTTSVTSNGTPEHLLKSWRAANPNLLIATGEHRGYLRLNITPKHLTADLVALDSVREARSNARTLKQFVIEAGKPAPLPG